jgi:PAS domain S-box-containing protein
MNKHFRISVVSWLQNGFATIFTDITDRKLAEEALKESEKKYRDMVEGSSDAIAIYNEGKVVYANNACISLFRASSIDQLIGMPVIKFVHPDSVAVVSERMKEIREFSNILPSMEEKLLRLDGTEIVTEIKAIPITFNQRPAVQIIIRDITERKRTEEKLIESEARLSAIFDNSVYSICVSKKGVQISGNPAFVKLFGYKNLTELVGKSILETIAPEERKRIAKNITDRAMDLEVPSHYETKGLRKDSSTFDMEVMISTYFINDEKYVVGFQSDITGRKQAEEKLRNSEMEFRNLFEDSLMGVSEAAPGGHLIQANQAYLQMYGYTNLDEMKAEVNDVGSLYVNPKDRKEGLRILAEKGVLEPREMEVVKRNGTRFFVLVSARAFRDAGGKPLYYHANYIDITERKQAEKEIKESKRKLEKLYRHLNDSRENERAEIAREIHDELGQSLTALKMDLHWTLQNVPDDLRINEKLKGMIDIVSKTIKKVQKISSDLRPGMLDDLGLIPSLEWYTKEFEERTGITCSLELEKIPHLNSKIRLVLFRIFQEGMTNIIRHANAKNVTVKLYSSPSQVFLKISDDGKGIKKEKINSKDSLGFIGMKERLKEFDGTLEIISSAKNGAGLLVSIPIVK